MDTGQPALALLAICSEGRRVPPPRALEHQVHGSDGETIGRLSVTSARVSIRSAVRPASPSIIDRAMLKRKPAWARADQLFGLVPRCASKRVLMPHRGCP